MEEWTGGYCRVFNTLGTEPSDPLAYGPGSEHHRPIMSIIGGHGGRLEIDRGVFKPQIIG